jgi:Protein of unknown function (DUF3021).
MTLKKALLRGALGAPLGVFLNYTITILIALFEPRGGGYAPVVPLLAEAAGNELKAVILQYLLSALLGFAFAVGSAVFEVDEWSITRQTVVHFIISVTAMLPIAYICYWMQHTLWGIISYISIFIVIYVIIWGIQIYFWKKRIDTINKQIRDNNLK